MTPHAFDVNPIGVVHSSLTSRSIAPRQGSEGAPDGWLELKPEFAEGLGDIAVGSEIILITWLHQAERTVLKTHPRGDPSRPIRGVFATRSPDRPNPIGLHRVKVLELNGGWLRVGPLEVVDGTPLIDIKSVRSDQEDT